MVKKKPKPNKDYTEDALGIGKDLFSDDPIRNLINRYLPIPTVEAPEGLVPIGDDGLYMTPDEPADPTDCDRYPSSIYCGENPFTLTPVAIEPSIIIDECNIGIQLEPTFGFVKLPLLSIVYRRPGCREDKRELPKPKLPDTDNYNEPPTFNRINCGEGSAGTILAYEEEYRESYGLDYSNIYAVYKILYKNISYTKVTNEILEVNHPYKIRYLHNENNNLVYLHMKVLVTTEQITNAPVEGFTKNTPAYQKAAMRPGKIMKSSRIEEKWLHKYNEGGYPGRITTSTTNIGVHNYGNLHANIERGIEQINRCRNMQSSGYAPSKDDFDRDLVYDGVPCYNTYFFKQTNQVLQYCDHPVLIIPPPPPLIKPPKKMECCPEHTLLLLSLIKKVDKLSKIIGVDEYPASLPASLISKDEGFLGNLIPNANREIPNLTQFLAWYVERFDEIMGQWEIPIEVKDSDPTKPGDQPVGFKLPNMAEALAEMFGLMLQTSINSETLVNMNTRALLEEGQIKQQGFKTYMMAQAIADHLGFQYEETKHKIPMLFKVGEEELDKLLQESALEVTAIEHTDTSDLKTILNDLLQAAAIIRAVHFRQFDPKQDVKQQFKNLINNLVASGDKVNNQQTDSAGKDDFDRFVEDAETGFTQYPGASDSTHPYGRNYNERPKIREISIDTSDSNP